MSRAEAKRLCQHLDNHLIPIESPWPLYDSLMEAMDELEAYVNMTPHAPPDVLKKWKGETR